MIGANREKRRRTGFTLIEALVGTVCGVLLIISLILMLQAGLRLFRAEEGRTSALQNMLLAYDRVQNDLRQTLFYPALEHVDAVMVEDAGRALTLSIFHEELPLDPPLEKPEIMNKMIRFSLQGHPKYEGAFYLTRTEGAETAVYKSIMLRNIYFAKETQTLPDEGTTSVLKMFLTVYSTHDEFDGLVFPFIFVLEPETRFMRDMYWQSGF